MLDVCSTRTWTKVRPNPPKSSEMEELNFCLTAPSLFLVSISFFPSSRTRGGSDWVLGPFWSVALLFMLRVYFPFCPRLVRCLARSTSWKTFVKFLRCSVIWCISDVICMFEFWRQCKYWLLIKLAMPSGTCWIWNQPLWSFASQLLHEWAAGGTWRWERQQTNSYLLLAYLY